MRRCYGLTVTTSPLLDSRTERRLGLGCWEMHSEGFSRAGSVPGVGVDLAAALVARKSLLARARACAMSSYCGCPRRTFCTAFGFAPTPNARADLARVHCRASACSLVFWACRTDVLLHGMGRFARGVRTKK
jgi:hypothetical protein